MVPPRQPWRLAVVALLTLPLLYGAPAPAQAAPRTANAATETSSGKGTDGTETESESEAGSGKGNDGTESPPATTVDPIPPTTDPAPGTGNPATPGAPAIRAVIVGDGFALVHWTAPAGNGGAAITGYEVQPVNALTGAVGRVRRAAADAIWLTVGGLWNGTPYWFRVRAVNEAGAGALSAGSRIVMPCTVPDLPATVTVSPGAWGGGHGVTVRWAPAADGGSAVLGYRVTRQRLDSHGAPVGAATVANYSAGTRKLTYTAPRAVPAGTRYRFTVQVRNELGRSGGRSAIGAVR
jgi:hypothetical protein